MAVQQNKKSHSKKGMRRSHDRVATPTVVYCTCGAPLLGLQNISIVCHGRSNAKAICNATRMATLFVEKETNKRLMETICANEELTRFGRSC